MTLGHEKHIQGSMSIATAGSQDEKVSGANEVTKLGKQRRQ